MVKPSRVLERLRERPLILVLAFSALLLGSPMLEDAVGRQFFFAIAFSLIVAASLFSSGARRFDMVAGAIVGTIAVASSWLAIAIAPELFGAYPLLVFALFLAITAKSLLTRLLHAREVGSAEVEISLCVYFIFGYFFAMLFAFLEAAWPGSLSGAALATGAEESAQVAETVYFSFVTLTTLGYGDITPASSFARGLTVLEALLGQIYLVVLVARLVSLQASRNAR